MKLAAKILTAGMLVWLVVGCGGGKKLSPEEYQQLSPQERIQYLEEQARKHPDDVEVRRQLYREYLNIEMVPQAVRVMEELLALSPYEVDVRYEYGELQYKSGNYRQAYAAFLEVLQSASGEAYAPRIAQYVAGKYLIQQITSDPADEAFPMFSPDGKKLIYQKWNGDNWDVVEYDLESQTEKVLIGTPADEELPAYSPDGTRIVFTSNAADHRPVDRQFKVREISIIDLSDRYTQNLTQSVADDWLPRFDPTGNFIVFVSDRSDLRKVSIAEKQSDLFIMESDGDFQHQLTHSSASEGGPCFSADGKRIFFHSDKNGNFDIFVMRADGRQVMTVVDSPANDVHPYASPDSQYIAFVSDRDGNYEIYRATVTGADPERLTFHPGTDSNPVYSPDGKVIAFHSNRSGNYDIYFINLEVSTSGVTTADLIQRLQQL
ncbi:MAG: hypothetical protein D6681_05895, partial [Calditrichaeota bacterium]